MNNRLTRIVFYEPFKIYIDAVKQSKIIMNVIFRQHFFLNSIVSNINALFTINLLLFLCYFLGMKQKLFNIFYLKINS